MDGALSRAVSAAARYVADSNCDNTAVFEDSLRVRCQYLESLFENQEVHPCLQKVVRNRNSSVQ